MLKPLVVWLGLLVLAIGNGALREGVLMPLLGLRTGSLLSGLLLAALILGVTYAALPWMGVRGAGGLLAVGVGWLVLTLVFEFSFGLWQGKSLNELLAAYTFRDGNIWPIVLGVTALAPCLAARVRGWVR